MQYYSLRKLTSEVATRKRLNSFTNLMGILPDPNKILEENAYDYSIFRDLLTDPHLAAALQQRKMQVLEKEIYLHGTTEQIKRARKVLSRIGIFRIINECLNSLLYGFSPMEVIYDYDELENELIITDLREKPQEWFIFDTKNDIKLRKKDSASYLFEAGQALPDYKFIIVRNLPSYENPYGEKLLANVYWPVIFKRAAIEYWQDRVERYGLPFIEGDYPDAATPEDITAFETKIEEMLETNILTKKESYKLSFKEPPKYELGKSFEYLINFHNNEISKAILSETLTIEIGSSGSYNAADVHREMLKMLGNGDKQLPELTLNRLLQYDMFLNFGEVEAAKVELVEEDEVTDKNNLLNIRG